METLKEIIEQKREIERELVRGIPNPLISFGVGTVIAVLIIFIVEFIK